jgi:hypothetical protein
MNVSDDWYTKPGKVEKGMEFPILDPAKTYTLVMKDISFQAAVSRTFKGETRVADEITTIWEVDGTAAKVWQRFTHSWNVKANMVIFINRMGYYLPEGQTGTLAAYFTLDPPARVKCRLIPREKDGQPTGYYSIDLNTVQPADKPAAAPAPSPSPSTPAPAPASTSSGLAPEREAEVTRIYEFLREGRFSVKGEAENIAMKFLGVKDGTLFAVAWARYAKGELNRPASPVVVGS